MSLIVDTYIIECRSIIQFSFIILSRESSAIWHTRKRLHNKYIPVCIIYSVGPSRARIAIITVVQHGISSDGSNFGPIGRRADNCCAEPDGGRRMAGRRASRRVAELRNPIYGGVLFFAFLRVVARTQECTARTFSGSYSAAVLVGDEKKWGWKSVGWDGVGGRSDEWIEACGTRSPTRPSGNSTRSSTYHPLSCVNAKEGAAGRQAGRQSSRSVARERRILLW